MSLILLADDEVAFLEAFHDVVGALGHECITARDGAEAFELAQARRPDLVLADYMMPGMSGVDLLRAMRAYPSLAHIPVVLVSAGFPREADEAWRYLPKPLDLVALEQAIDEGLRLSRERASRASPQERAVNVSALKLARDEMLNWVAHEIKSPLSAAMVSAQLIRRSVESGEKVGTFKRRVDVILRQLSRMDELVRSILDAAKLAEGKLPLSVRRVDLRPVLGQLLEAWRESHPDRRFELRLPEGPVEVEADVQRVRQIVENLISNAVKYGKASGPVTVELEVSGAEARVRVRDEGPGIPEAQLTRLFERFHRVGLGGQGHGLGLYIAAALARLHRGALEAASKEGEGSVFTLRLPACSAAERAAASG